MSSQSLRNLATYSLPLRGGVSRPSSSAWTVTGTPAARTVRARNTMWSWWECTPPGDIRPIRWQVPPLSFRVSIIATSALASAIEPSSTALSMRGNSCITTRPAPRFMWPTSELPICPSGRPTSRPEALSVVIGQVATSRSQLGVSARATALSEDSVRRPQPSRMHRTTGRGRCADVRVSVMMPIIWFEKSGFR